MYHGKLQKRGRKETDEMKRNVTTIEINLKFYFYNHGKIKRKYIRHTKKKLRGKRKERKKWKRDGFI